ncbi:MAG TPA: hypothetical protein VIU82_26050 [Bosea sp. (in: a-proteobacteria)]
MVDDTLDMKPAPAAYGAMAPKERSDDAKPEVDPARAALVAEWLKRAKRAKKKWETAFKRMDECQQLAAEGATEEWVKAGNYVVPVIVRHINQAVAQLYAKNPKAVAKRKKRMMYTLWDGRSDTLQAAMEAANPQPPMDPMTGMPLAGGPTDPMTGAPLAPEPDPNAVAMIQEIAAVREQNDMIDRMGKTQELLWDYFTTEQSGGFKQQVKAAIRRTKVNSVSWCKLVFQRELEARPEIGAQIDDTTQQIARLEQLGREVEEGDTSEDSARVEELRLLLQQLQGKESIIVREGPVFDWPRSKDMYPDEKCTHLKTLFGAQALFHEFMLSPDEVESIYGVDVCGNYTEFKGDDRGDDEKGERPKTSAGDETGKGRARVIEVQDKRNGQFLTICEGYPDFLKEPAEPDVKIERFFTGFPLVFNETENEKDIYPPSDVWLMRHLQFEYNRKREALREHCIAAAPNYVVRKGHLDKVDRAALQGAKAHEVIEVKTGAGEDVAAVIKRLEKANIDPNLYEVEQVFSDMQRVSGAQEANLGGTSDGTATESTIAEQSRTVSLSENVDDLDEWLSDIAAGTGQLMMLELSKETVQGIVGPGAVWPDMQTSREEIAQDLLLEIKAGSSGRPNAAAELAKLERAMPYIVQMPDMNPKVFAKRYLELLDIDVEDAFVEGLPSITALNSMMAKGGVQAGTGDPATDPNAQGQQGGQNAAQQPGRQAGPQPAFPAGNA